MPASYREAQYGIRKYVSSTVNVFFTEGMQIPLSLTLGPSSFSPLGCSFLHLGIQRYVAAVSDLTQEDAITRLMTSIYVAEYEQIGPCSILKSQHCEAWD